MEKKIIIAVITVVWIYLLTVFKRKKFDFFYFVVGSVGAFFYSFFLLQPILTGPLARLVCYLTGLLGDLTGMFQAYSDYGILFIEHMDGPISLYIDFECAGLVEILVYIVLVGFYAVYNWKEKLALFAGGILWIMAANVFRLFVICCIIHIWGNEAYYMAHTIVGRLLFYGLSICLYFYVFTRAQIRKQRVGGFGYDDKN